MKIAATSGVAAPYRIPVYAACNPAGVGRQFTRAVLEPSTARVIWAGLLCGIAPGFKLTNAVYSLSGFVVLIMLPLNLRGGSVMVLPMAFRWELVLYSSPRPGPIVSSRGSAILFST
jgi:hypothetical protein